MGIRSELCVVFYILKKDKTESINKIKEYLIKTLSNLDNFDLLKSFYEIVDSPNDKFGFCYFEESIKFQYIQSDLDNFLNFLNEINIEYEAQELCELSDFENCNYSRRSKNSEFTLTISCNIYGVPEVNELTFIEWLIINN